MSGILLASCAQGAAAYSGTLSIGSEFAGGGKGGGGDSARGLDVDGVFDGVPFGSITPAAWHGFTIKEMLQVNSGGTTVFGVSGDATALSPQLFVDGVDQHLGSGTFSGGKTTWSSTTTATDPFSGSSAAIIIKG